MRRVAAFDKSTTPISGGRLIAWLVASAYFMELLDGTVISTALPQIAHSFNLNPIELNVGMSAYLLTLGVFIPLSGWVADRFGARSVFAAAILLFTFASILCGASFDQWSFTGARILQGVGGAMMVPVGRLIVLKTTEKKDLLPVLAMVVWPGLFAPVIGPGIGGFFATYLSWRWIFFLNVPLGAVAVALILLFIPTLPAHTKRRPDVIGFLLSGFSIVALVYGADAFGNEQIGLEAALVLLASGLVVGAAALRRFQRIEEPLIDFRALQQKTFSVFFWAGSLFRIAIGTTPLLLPLMFQVAFGLNSFTSGLLVMGVFVGNIAIKPATIPLLRLFGFKKILIWNGVLVALTLAACGLLTPSTPFWLIEFVLFLGGASRSLQFTALNTMQFADVPQNLMSGANTLSSMIAQLTMGVGVAVGALTIDCLLWVRGGSRSNLSLADFHTAFESIGAVSLLCTFDYLGLAKGAGNTVARRGASAED